MDFKSDAKADAKATSTSEKPLNLHRPPSDSKTLTSGKKTPVSQFHPRSSSTSPPLPASKEPTFEGIKPPQYSYGTDGPRDKGVQNWGAPTVTEKLAQLIATCPPSKTPKPVKPAKIEAAPLLNSGFMAPTAKQRDRAMANRNTYSRMVHLSPPPPVSRPPGRPYGSRSKDSMMEASSAMTSFSSDDADGCGKAGGVGNNNISSSGSGSGSSRSSSPALVYASSRLSSLSKDSGSDNSSMSKAQSRSAHAAASSSCPMSSSSSISSEQRTISAVSHLGSPAPSQGHHAHESPALAEESTASMMEQERNSPRDLTKCPPPPGTGKSEGRDKPTISQLLNIQRGTSSSPSKRSPNRDNSRSGQASSLAGSMREASSPEPDVEDSPRTPLRDDSPDSSIDSPNEQESKPLKKRRGRKPRWNRIMIKAQTHRAGEGGVFDHSKPSLPLSSSFELPPPPMKRPVGRPPNPNKVKQVSLSQNAASQLFPPQAKKRGRPKSKMPRLDAPARGCLSSKLVSSKVFALKSKEEQDPPVLHPEVDLNPPKPLPRKRGRPKRLPPTLPQEGQPPTLAPESGEMGDKLFHSKGNGQLIMKTIIGKINKMKSMKRKRILSQILLGPRTEELSKSSSSVAVSSGETATQSLSTLAASFGGKLGPQINVSKKGTIYMGKRRGRKPKAATTTAASADSFLSPNTSSPFHHHHHHHHLQSQQHLSSEIFPSPSLSQSSGGHSPISDGFVEPGSVHFPSHSHHAHHSHGALSFPPPTFSAPNPRSLGLGSMSSVAAAAAAASQKKSTCRGYHHHHHHYRQHFHYHKLSPPRPLHPTSPAPLNELKEATPSPVSESHSEETVPSDSGIGTDNNSTSDRGEKAGGAGGLGGMGMPAGRGGGLLMPGVMGSALGPGVALNSRGRRRHSAVLLEHPSPSPSPHGARSSSDLRRSHAAAPASSLLGHKEKHKHKCKRRSHGCPGYDKLKRQKRKRKKKYLQLRARRHDPDFLAELDEIVVRLSEVRISHRITGHRLSAGLGMASGTGRVPGVGSRAMGGAGGPPSHHYVHRDLLPTIFRVNFGSFYSHPAYSCDPLHYVRKPDMKKKRGRPPKLRESMSEVPFVPGLGFPLSSGGFYHPSYGVPYSSGPLGLGYYRGYPPASALYPHPHHQSPHSAPSHHSHHSPTFPPPPPTSYMHHHHASHLLLNPSKFHKKKHKLLRQEYLGGGRAPVLYPPMSSELSFNWHHKHKHRHKHRERCADEDREEPARAGSDARLAAGISDGGASGKAERVSGLGMAESLQRCRFGRDPSGVAAGKQAASTSANSPSSSSSSSAADRYKRKENSASCIGPSRLALSTSKSHHPVESWFRMGSSKTDYSKLSQPHAGQGQGLFSDGRADNPAACSESDDEEPLTPTEDAEARVHESSNHTNLFASALTRTSLKGSKSRKAEAARESSTFSRADRPVRKERSASVEKRELGTSTWMEQVVVCRATVRNDHRQ